MRYLGTLAAVAFGVALSGPALAAAKAPAKPAQKAAAAEPVPVAAPLNWKAKDDAPGWVHENVARFVTSRTTDLPKRWASMQRFRREMAGKTDADSRKQVVAAEQRWAEFIGPDAIPPIAYAIGMDPKAFTSDGPAYGACHVTVVKVLGEDKALADVIIGAHSIGAPGARKPDGDVSKLPTVQAVVQHRELPALGKWFKPGQSTNCVLEKAGTEEVDGKTYPFLRLPDIKPYLVPVK